MYIYIDEQKEGRVGFLVTMVMVPSVCWDHANHADMLQSVIYITFMRSCTVPTSSFERVCSLSWEEKERERGSIHI